MCVALHPPQAIMQSSHLCFLHVKPSQDALQSLKIQMLTLLLGQKITTYHTRLAEDSRAVMRCWLQRRKQLFCLRRT